MIGIVAAAAETAVQQPGAITTYGPWGILIAMGGWKGVAQAILWLQRRNGDGIEKARETCPVHDGLVKLLDERKMTQDKEFKEIKDAQKTFADRTDDNFRELFVLLRK